MENETLVEGELSLHIAYYFSHLIWLVESPKRIFAMRWLVKNFFLSELVGQLVAKLVAKMACKNRKKFIE